MAQEDKIARNKDSAQRAALHWNKLANERLFDLHKQLLGLATLLLPLTASIVIVDSVKLLEVEKTLLLLGWAFLGISIIAGLIQLIIEAKYFNYLSNDSSCREEIWSSERSIEDMQKETKALGRTNPSSTLIPLSIQTFSIFIGLSLIMIVATFLLLRK